MQGAHPARSLEPLRPGAFTMRPSRCPARHLPDAEGGSRQLGRAGSSPRPVRLRALAECRPAAEMAALWLRGKSCLPSVWGGQWRQFSVRVLEACESRPHLARGYRVAVCP